MGEHDRSPVTWGAMLARDNEDRAVGYQAFRAVRGKIKTEFTRTLVGPVRDTYQEAAQDARVASDEEKENNPVASFEVKYPEIEVTLVGEDGNAFNLIGKVQGALRKAGVSKEEIAEFNKEATSGDYDHVIQTCMSWVTVD